MQATTASKMPALALSLVVTLAVLIGIDSLAVREHASVELMASSQMSQVHQPHA